MHLETLRGATRPGSVPKGRHAIREKQIVAEHKSPALTVAMALYQAWTGKDLDLAMSYVSDDIVCEAPPGRIEGKEQYRAFWGPFSRISQTPRS